MIAIRGGAPVFRYFLPQSPGLPLPQPTLSAAQLYGCHPVIGLLTVGVLPLREGCRTRIHFLPHMSRVDDFVKPYATRCRDAVRLGSYR